MGLGEVEGLVVGLGVDVGDGGEGNVLITIEIY